MFMDALGMVSSYYLLTSNNALNYWIGENIFCAEENLIKMFLFFLHRRCSYP